MDIVTNTGIQNYFKQLTRIQQFLVSNRVLPDCDVSVAKNIYATCVKIGN